MIDLAILKGSSFVVLGLARSGLATVRALRAAGIDCIAWDDSASSREAAAEAVPVDLAALVKETAQNMTVNARRAYVTLQYDARPATVQGSRDQLSELTQNLCDNAIRYNRPGGHVELRCGVGSDGCPYVEVEDNGIGIPQDSQTRVFERFYRVDKSRSKATGGTGLGLAIVKHIALLHDGRPRQGLSDATPGQNGFAGDHGLVDAGLAGQHDAVQRYALAGADHQQIAGLHAVDVDVLGLGRVEPSVAGCLAGGQILGQWRSDIEDVGDTWAQLDQ